MCKGLVSLGHSVHIFFALECTTFIIVCRHNLGTQFFSHRAAGAFAGEGDHILHRERNLPLRAEKLCAEIIAAYNNEGGAFKRKEDMHKMAEANKAFAHFRF